MFVRLPFCFVVLLSPLFLLFPSVGACHRWARVADFPDLCYKTSVDATVSFITCMTDTVERRTSK